ncbi:MAG: TolC family protein [Desulfomonilaceae bacterium]
MERSWLAKILPVLSLAIMIVSAGPLQVSAGDKALRSAKLLHRDMRLTLQQAVSIAVDRNLRAADSRLAVQEKEHQRREAFSDLFPSLSLQYTSTWFRYEQAQNIAILAGKQPGRWIIRGSSVGNGLTPNYPYRIDPFRSFTLSATVTQPIFSGGGLLNNYKFAKLGVDYSAIQYEVDTQDLILDVTEAYYELVQAEKLQEVAEQSIRSLEALRNQTREFFQAGTVAKVDLLSTEGQLAQARIQRTQSLTEVRRQKAQLAFLLRYPQETPVDVVQDINYRPNLYRIPEIYAIAAANRPEIRQANISVDQASALLKASQADLMPAVSLQAQGTRINDDWNVFDPEGTNDWRIQLLLTWTFDIFRTRETVKEKRATQARAFVAREQLIEQVMNEVKSAYLDMKSSESTIADSRAAVVFREENFRISQQRYQVQEATYIEVLDAQRQLAQAQGDYYTALIGYRINQAVLERRLGILR